MIVYHATKSQFVHDAANGIEDIVRQQLHAAFGIDIRPNSSEYNSWKNSLGNAMFHVMNTDAIPDDTTVAIEYVIPRSRNRIDFMIIGQNAEKREQVIVVELKQWTEVGITEKDAVVETQFQGRWQETLHPSYQAWSYTSLLKSYNETVYSEKISLHPCAYLHNLSEQAIIANEHYGEHLENAPVFCKGEKEKLQAFIQKYVQHGDSRDALYRIEAGRVRPSKELADNLVSLMKGNKEFVLIDDQKLVYEHALSLVRRAKRDEKQVFIIEGGPGTGKSVVAINLLVQLIKEGKNSQYVTKNAAPRAVFEAKLSGSMRKSVISSLFQGSGGYTDAAKNELDVIIADEAHRLNEKSGIYRNLGENQIKEIIHAAQTSIFFVDEDQRVTWQDIGDIAEIEKWATQLNASIHKGKLETQFRCSGSDGYLAWVDHILQIRETANTTLDGVQHDFKVFDSPAEMHQQIREKNMRANKARLVAGYCWDWISKKNSQSNDIVIPEHNFAVQWNLVADGNTYVIAPNSVEQAGCIHTCQGLDLEYVGVIIGPDLVVRNGVVQTNPTARAKTDKSLSGYKKALKAHEPGTEAKADKIIKNTYRTLMTRGLKGCYVYCTDEETREWFKNSATVIE